MRRTELLQGVRMTMFRDLQGSVRGRKFEQVGGGAAVEGERAGGSAKEYREYLTGEGARKLEECLAEADDDQIFGVPIFVFRGELFWGHDRMVLLEERLGQAGLKTG